MSDMPLEILLVEDSAPDVVLMREMLGVSRLPGFDLHVADAILSAWGFLLQNRMDVILLDLSLPDSRGMDTIRAIHTAAQDAAVIVLTGHDDETLGIQAVREGAQDYLVKGQVDPRLLGRAILHAVERMRAISERREHARQLAVMSAQVNTQKSLLEAVLKQMPAGVVVVEAPSGRPLLSNERVADILQCELPKDARDCQPDKRDIISDAINGEVPQAEDSSGIHSPLKRALYEGLTTNDQEHAYPRRDGSRGIAAVSAAPVRDPGGGQVIAAVATFNDITERKLMEQELRNSRDLLERRVKERTEDLLAAVDALQEEVIARRLAEQEVRRANRALRVLGECNQTMVKAVDEKHLLRDTCRNLVNLGGYRLAWVGYAQDDAAKTIEPIACAGIGERALKNATRAWTKHKNGAAQSIAASLLTGQPQVVRNVASSKEVSTWRSHGGRFGIASLIVLPLVVEHHKLGVLVISTREADAFDDQEVRLLMELASDVSFGIASLRARHERQTAQKALIDQARIMEAFFKNTLTPLVFLDRHFNFIRVNEAYAKACQRHVEDFPGHNHFAFYPSTLERDFRKVVRTRRPFQDVDRPFIFPDHPEWGVTYWDLRLEPILDAQGRVDLLVFSLNDATQRKKARDRVVATNSLLELFARKTVRRDYLKAVVDLICSWTGCGAVGIRVRDEHGRVPFEAYRGFRKEFWQEENFLSLKKDDCACMRVMRGEACKYDESMMTASGSFLCGNTGNLLASLPNEAHKAFRGACIREGYKSVAIVPIRYRREIVGAMHLADACENAVSADVTEMLEMMSPLIGEALWRFSVEEAMRLSEEHFRSIFESSQDCVAKLTLSGQYMSMNPAGRALLGYRSNEDLSRRKCTAGVVENREALDTCILQAAFGQTVSAVYKTASGQREIWWDAKLTPILGLHDEISSILMVARDVTEHRRLEREIVEISSAERRRIGQDLHDALGQLLTGLAFLSKVLQQRLKARSLPEADDAGEIAKLMNQAVNQTRMLARGLCPVEPKADGLMAALQELSDSIHKMFSIACEFSCPGHILVDDDYTATHLYHIAQEAANNAVKHSKAKSILIELARVDGLLTMSVQDNGKGLPKELPSGGGMGLRTMRYRASLIGASLDISKAGKSGTVVTCTLAARSSNHLPA